MTGFEFLFGVLLAGLCAALAAMRDPGDRVKLVIVDPGHFHATLIQREMYPWIAPRVSVYAPLSPELLDYMSRIALFNTRKENPTRWELDVHTGPDFFDRLLAEHPGNVVMFAGRNRGKIDRIARSIEAGFHVFADKPWIIASEDLPKLERALDLAEQKGLAAYDIMTERFEITSILQRELVNSPEVFGRMVEGSAADPGIRARSVHHLMKLVAGVPIKRPAGFFDVKEYGEALADVGTHVADLAQWTAFPDQPIDYRADLRVLDARHWPTVITRTQFQQVTGETDFTPALAPWVKDGHLEYYGNNFVHYTLRGIHVALDILWNWEAKEGGDVYEAAFRGSRARAEIRQGRNENFRPELYLVANTPELAGEVFAALRRKVGEMQRAWPGLGMKVNGQEARIEIPEQFRVGHEAHFAQVFNRFAGYFRDPKSLPRWEKSCMLAKYYVTTKGVELSQQGRP